MDRSDRMALAADRAGSPSTSVITWIGYDAPQSFFDAASTDYADNAKADLDRFQDGLRASHEGPPDQVYATVAENDIIHLANMENPEDIHEMDPTDPDFGAHVFAANPGTPGPIYQGGYSVDAHSEYWGQDNKALENMGLIIAGEQTK